MGQRFWIQGGKLVPYGTDRSSCVPVFGVIDDTMPPTENHADGQIYDSKSAFRCATKAAGFVEVGNDLLSKQKIERRSITDMIPDSHIDNALKEAFERHNHG